MRKLRNYGACMAAAVLSAAVLLASCRHAGGGGGGGGAVYTPSSGSSGGGSGSAASTTATYTSYDSAGGYFNVNGGQYRTCTLTGNSTGGTITLSNGVAPNLTGSYGTPNGSVSLAAAPNVELKIEGCFTVTFNGVSHSYSYSVLITRELISIRGTGSNGTKVLYTAGAAVSSDSAAAATGSGIAPGSAGDPFNGTGWSINANETGAGFRFENGAVTPLGLYANSPAPYFSGPYTVSRTGDGYKVCFGFQEQSISGSYTGGTYNFFSLAYYTFTISDASTEEVQLAVEGIHARSQTGTHSYNYENQASYVMGLRFYRITQ